MAALCGVAALWLAAPLTNPALAQTGAAALPCGAPHVVASGDTLSKLADRAYGDPALYTAIAEANREALGGGAGNLAVGMSLTIPCLDGGGRATSPAQAAAMRSAIDAEGMLTPDQLDTLFGPVALFPDPLLTPVLVAVTFPLDVVKAARFVEENEGRPDAERARLAAAEPWDNSVRELAAGFPDVVTRMSDNIDWTEQAGEAVVAQTDEVLASIQRLRGKAQANGYLVDNQAQKVEQVDDKIVIAPAEPNVVYVPTYDSQVVYSQPVSSPPVYHYGYDYNDNWYGWDDALVTGGIILGGAVLLDEIFDDGDWNGWNGDDDIDWDRGDITIDRGDRNIERGDISIDRDKINIGDRERIERDRGDLALGAGAGVALGAGAGAALANRPEARKSLSNPADRAAARQKIETRKAKGTAPARLDATRKTKAGSQAKARAANPKATARSNVGARSKAASKTRNVSRPNANRAPAARAPSRSNTFAKPAGGGPRASASSSRGRASMGGRSGGGRGGGGGGRRR